MSSDVENSATATPPSGDEEADAPQRGATRAPIQCPVRLQFDDAIEVVEGTCRNVSIGGMFVRSAEARRKGSLVRFELVLEDQASIRGLAEVVWMRPRDEASGRQAGMGLRFRFLEQRDRQMIFKLVSQHIKERLASRHPSMEEPRSEGGDEASEPAPPVTPEPSPDSSEPAESPAATEATEPTQAAPVRTPPAAEETDSGEQRSLLFDQQRFDEDETSEAGPPEARPSAEPVVDEFDGRDERTAAWMNDAVAGTEPDYATYEGSSDDEDDETGWDGDASWVGGSARVQEEERGPLRVLAAVALLLVLVLVAVGVYFFGDRIFGGGDDVAPVGEAAEVPMESDARATTGAEGESAPAPEAGSEPETAAPSETRTPEPEPAPPPPPVTTRQQTPPPAAEPAAGAFRRVRDISVRQVGDVSRVVIETDGAIAADRYSHSRVTTAPPRELIRLRGLTTRFIREIIPIGGPRVSRVRTGWHRKPGGNELHVVLDLASPSARVTDLSVDGPRLIVTVEGS